MTFKMNAKAWETLRKGDEARSDLLARATRAKEAADAWMGTPGSFKVVREEGKHRARYTVRPNTFAAVRYVAKHPTEFTNVCLAAGRNA